jgi:hypothetical protein
MTSRLREISRGTLPKAVILAAALLLLLPTPAWANGWGRAMGEILLVFFILPVTGATALGISIALSFRVFRSQRALWISFVFSTLASVLALWWLVADWQYLPKQIRLALGTDRAPFPNSFTYVVLALLGAMVLLFFAWCAPVVQHFRLRPKPDDGERQVT